MAYIAAYPFLSNSITSLVKYLRENAPNVSSHQLLVADAQTLEDKSLLFVDVGPGYYYDGTASPDEVKTVRLSAQYANAIPVAVAVATMGIEEVIVLADKDGVFRGGRSSAPPIKGMPMPPMQLVRSS